MSEALPKTKAGREGPTLLSFEQKAEFRSQEAEIALLACCFVDEGATVRLSRQAGLVAKSFVGPSNAFLWKVMTRVVDAGHPVTVETVLQEAALFAPENVDLLGGEAALRSLESQVSTTTHARFFLSKILDLWHARVANWWLAQARVRITEHPGDWKATFPGIEAAMSEIARLRPVEGVATLREEGTRSAEWLRLAADGKLDTTRHLALGLPKMEAQCGRLAVDYEDFLVVIGGRPSEGKSALARGIVDVNLAEGGRNFAVFLLETTRGMWLRQMASARSRVNLRSLEQCPRDMVERLLAAHAQVESHLERELWVWDDVYELDAILAKARDTRKMLEERGGLHGVVIDYLQQVQVARMQKAPREQQVAYISRQLKFLGKELGCPVIALAQLNRGCDKDERRPRKSDLRESGALEQDADKILLLHKPKVDMRGVEQTENQQRVMEEVLQVKSRNGALGAFRVWLDRPWTRFVEIGEAETVSSVSDDGGAAARPKSSAFRPAPGMAKGRGYGRQGMEVNDDEGGF